MEVGTVAGTAGSGTGSLEERLVRRLFRYLAVPSQSDARARTVPSTEGQWAMARLLKGELEALGLAEVHLDERAVLTARLPGNAAGAAAEMPAIGFCAHVDTVDVGLSPEIRPRVARFEGRDLCLNEAKGIWLRVAEHPEIQPYLGQEVVVTDGTSVLGADNKAAVAILMELVRELTRDEPDAAPRGDVFLAFVPDEEIGLKGAKAMDLARFPVAFAYTIDGCALGELTFECFNAATATIDIEGVPAHPVSAKGVLVNPALVAADLVRRFDPLDTPEHTEGREGYCWVTGLQAGPSTARLTVNIRDFDDAGFGRRKRLVEEHVAAVRAAWPRATLRVSIEDSYGNIASAMGNDRRSVAVLERAFAAAGVEPRVVAMRGGTDGSALSARGVPTPNFFTGGLNFHSPFEFLPVPSFAKAYAVARAVVHGARDRTGR
ncbi:MAG: peptidase T [Gluconacetobacter diazotrophicus]|nr:peptidase T [Gluconacetobacter diazotrophicus]